MGSERLDKKTIRDLRGRAQSLQATVHDGKEGMTMAIADELRRQLKKNGLVKVRILRSFEGDREEAAKLLAEASGSLLVEVRGRTVVVVRE